MVHLGRSHSRRSILAAACTLLLPPKALSQDKDSFRDNCLALEKPWNLFIRKMFGCPTPAGDTSPETCKTEKRTVDMPSFNKAREAAKRLWGFK